MNESYAYPDELRNVARSIAKRADEDARKLEQQLEEAKLRRSIGDRIARYIALDWPLHLLAELKESRPVLRALASGGHIPEPVLVEGSRIAQERANVVLRDYPRLLAAACDEAGLVIDPRPASAHPRYSFQKGFFTLVVDDRAGTARLSSYETDRVVPDLPADIAAVVETVRREVSRVFDRSFDADAFLAKLWRQYSAILAKDGKREGEPIPIRRITTRLGKNEKGFRTDEFLIDLSRLVDQSRLTIEGRTLGLEQTRDTSQGMLLHGAGGRGYVGLITFTRR